MTLREATNNLYVYYKKKGYLGVDTWLQSIGEYDTPKEKKIIIFVRYKNFDYKKERKFLKDGNEYFWDTYPVEFKYIGEVEIA